MRGGGLAAAEALPQEGSGGSRDPRPGARERAGSRRRVPVWLFLLLATLWSLITLGAVFVAGARTDFSTDLLPWWSARVALAVWSEPGLLDFGLPFGFASLLVLGAHELGHLLACRSRGIATTPPYFLPAPIGVGTFGAFLKIRSPIRDRNELVLVAASGPLAGAALFLPVLVAGIFRSEVTFVQLGSEGSVSGALLTVPGRSLLSTLLIRIVHGPLPEGAVLNPDPLYLAAWLGMVATMLNLLPVGQLDGGHLLYAAVGRSGHRRAWPWVATALFLAGWFWPGWWLWAALTLLLGRTHPRLLDETEPLDASARLQIAACGGLLVATFLPIPVRGLPFLG